MKKRAYTLHYFTDMAMFNSCENRYLSYWIKKQDIEITIEIPDGVEVNLGVTGKKFLIEYGGSTFQVTNDFHTTQRIVNGIVTEFLLKFKDNKGNFIALLAHRRGH